MQKNTDKKGMLCRLFPFLCAMTLAVAGCSSTSVNNSGSSNADSIEAKTENDEAVIIEANADEKAETEANAGSGAMSECGAKAETDDMGMFGLSDNAERISVKVTEDYIWYCDAETGYMYLQTEPTINSILRGAVLDTDLGGRDLSTCVATTIIPTLLREGDEVIFPNAEGMSYSYYLATLNDERHVYECSLSSGWKDSDGAYLRIENDCYIVVDFAYSDVNTAEQTDIDKSRAMTAQKAAELSEDLEIYRNHVSGAYEVNGSVCEAEIIQALTAEGNPYVLIKIPSELSDGEMVMPKVASTTPFELYSYPTYDKLTDYDKKVIFRSVLSPLMYSQVYHTGLTINAGLFNIFSNTPQGQTILEGRVVTNSPMKDDIGDPISPDTECYAMTIDAAGMLDFAKDEGGRPFRTIDAQVLSDGGAYYSVTGWGCIVYNGKSVVEMSADRVNESTIFYERVHRRKVAHQVIGQDDAGNYYILSSNDEGSDYGYGFDYDEAAEIMLAAGATFAYMLDGGDSVATVVGEKQLTTLFFGDFGKPVPTVINFGTQ